MIKHQSESRAVFHIPYNHTDLKDVIALLQKKSSACQDTHLMRKQSKWISFHLHRAVVMGSEGQGVSDEVLKCVNGYFKIPMTHFESLNVAVAAGIICYYLRKG